MIVMHCETTGSVKEKNSLTRRLTQALTSLIEMNALDRLIYGKRQFSA